MAHEFKIMNQSGTITTYTSYDDIPNNSTLKHVISFKPDLGTEIDSNEILLESETLDSGETDKFIEDTSTGANLVLNGTDSSSSNAGDNLIMEFPDGRHKLVPENFETGAENHLVLETASTMGGTNHYHPMVGTHHTEGDGHTAEEHREIALWNYRLQTLITTEKTNASSV
jgi:hypothetical protein